MKRLRLSVFRSNKSIYGQIIDDEKKETVVAASEKGLLTDKKNKKASKIERARLVGKLLAEKAKTKGIKKIRFDRGRYRYHGRVKALAEGARAGGLEF